MSATGLMLVHSLNTWLPEIMLLAGFNAMGSLSFPAVLNGGSLFGALAASRAADRFGPKHVVAACFATGAVALVLLPQGFALAGLPAIVAAIGLGTSGSQTLIYGFVANSPAIIESARRFRVAIGLWPLIGAVDAACDRLRAFRDAAPAAQPDAR